METPLAPHPQTPSPREFGLRLMKLAKRVRPNSRGEGAFNLLLVLKRMKVNVLTSYFIFPPKGSATRFAQTLEARLHKLSG